MTTDLLTRPGARPWTPEDLEILDAATRREFLAGLAAAGLLAACGDGDPIPALAPTATRQVTDLLDRTVEVPTDPQRVVVLDSNRVISAVVELGIIPVGVTTNPTNGGSGLSPLLDVAEGEVSSVGAHGAAVVEQIAALEPDLIFFSAPAQATLSVETLSAIAPVLAYEQLPGLLELPQWLGEVLGRTEQATALEREFSVLITERRDQLELAGRRVATINVKNHVAEPDVYVYERDITISEILAMLGAVYAPEQAAADGMNVSLELVSTVLADIDLLIGIRYAGGEGIDAEARFTTVTTSAVWQNVPAVAAGAVAYLDIHEALGNYGVDGLRAALDDLAEQLS